MVKHSWTSEFAVKTERMLRHAEAKKSVMVRFVDDALYWVLLLLAIFGNFVVSVVLVPFFLLASGLELYVALFVIGMSFGGVFSFILHGIEELQWGHHIIAGIFIPSLALLNVAVMAILSNALMSMLNVPATTHNPLLVGVVYVGGYILPDIVTRMRATAGNRTRA